MRANVVRSIQAANDFGPQHPSSQDQFSPFRHLATAIIAVACDDYRALSKRHVVSHLKPNKRHRFFAQRFIKYRTSGNCSPHTEYRSAANITDLLDFFKPGGSCDVWCGLAELGFDSCAVRRQLIGEEDGKRTTPGRLQVL